MDGPALRALVAADLDEAGYTAERLWDLEVQRAAVDLDNIMATAAATQKPRKLFRTTGLDLLYRDFPATPWLIRGLLVDAGLQCISAEAKGTKTWVTVEYAFAIASGTSAFGEFEAVGPPAPVCLFQAEDPPRAGKAKLRSIGASRGMTRDQIDEVAPRVHFENLTSFDLCNKAHLAELVASARTLPEKPKLIVFDPLIKFHKVKENDSVEMERVTGALHAIGRAVGCTVMFTHHNSKQTEGTKGRRGGQMMRGSSSLHGAVDGGLYFGAPTGNRQTEWVVRAESEIKGARSAGGFGLTLKVLKDDENGEAELISWGIDRGNTPAPTLKDRVVEALKQPGCARMSAAELRDATKAGKGPLATALRELVAEGTLVHEGGGHTSVYCLECEDPFDD